MSWWSFVDGRVKCGQKTDSDSDLLPIRSDPIRSDLTRKPHQIMPASCRHLAGMMCPISIWKDAIRWVQIINMGITAFVMA